ncbi:hypothetical protein ACWEN3_32270 [Streptomyces sp. NPDC004561]
MLYSRAGDYPDDQPMLYAEDFSANTVQGACPQCHGIGRVYEVTEQKMVPNPSLTIRQRAIASWPTAWHGHQLRDVLVALGYDVDVPWKGLKEGSGLDPIHRRDPLRPRPLQAHALRGAHRDRGGRRAELPGHIRWCAPLRARHLRQHQERLDEAPRRPVSRRGPVPVLPRQAAEARSPDRYLRRARHRRLLGSAAAGARLAAGRPSRTPRSR